MDKTRKKPRAVKKRSAKQNGFGLPNGFCRRNIEELGDLAGGVLRHAAVGIPLAVEPSEQSEVEIQDPHRPRPVIG